MQKRGDPSIFPHLPGRIPGSGRTMCIWGPSAFLNSPKRHSSVQISFACPTLMVGFLGTQRPAPPLTALMAVFLTKRNRPDWPIEPGRERTHANPTAASVAPPQCLVWPRIESISRRPGSLRCAFRPCSPSDADVAQESSLICVFHLAALSRRDCVANNVAQPWILAVCIVIPQQGRYVPGKN